MLGSQTRALRIEITYMRKVNWSLLRAGLPLVWRLAIHNRDVTPAVGVSLRLSLLPYLDTGPVALPEIAPGDTNEIAPAALPWICQDFAAAMRLPNQVRTSLQVEEVYEIAPLPWITPPAAAPGSPAAAPPAPPPSLWERGQAWLATTLLASGYTRRYLRNLMAQHHEFTFLGRAKPLQIECIYVGLKVGEYTPRTWLPDEPEASPAEEQRAPLGRGRTVDVPEALALSRRLVVLGDPGSGKTTLLKYLALQLAQRTPGLAPFARALIPTPMTRLLEPLCRFLSGANVMWPGVLSSVAGLIVWMVGVLRSSMPGPALVVWLLFFVLLVLLWVKLIRCTTAVSAWLALGLLVYAGWWEPHLVGLVAVWLMGISVGILLFPIWVQPPLALLRRLLRFFTRYPLPVYLTLNHLAHDTRPIEDHLADTMAEAGFPHPHRFLMRKLERGECLLLLDALDEVVDARAHQRVVTAINSLRAAYGAGNQIVVTSRVAGFQHALHGYLQFEV
jgi:hypothetical protein